MRYDNMSELTEQNLHLRKMLEKSNVNLRRTIVLLNKKQLSPSERTTLDLAMKVAGIDQEWVNKINANELPWPV